MADPVVLPGAAGELEHFMRLPWCRQQVLQKGTVVVPRLDQEKDGRGSTGKLFCETLNSPAAISHRIVLFQDPSLGQLNPDSKKNWLPLNTCTVFYQLGEGVCGFGDICHGGIQSTILDDVMGVLGVFNARLQQGLISSAIPGKCSPETNTGMLDLTTNMIATQGIQVEFLRPLRVPAVIQVTAHLDKIEDDGSSFTIHGVIKDGNDREFAKAKAQWAVIRPSSRL